MIGRHKNVVAIQIVDDTGHEATELVNRGSDRTKGLVLIAPVGGLVDLVVVDVDNPIRLDELTAILLVHRHEFFRIDGYAVNGVQIFWQFAIPLVERPSLSTAPFAS